MSLRDDLNITLPSGVYENAKDRYDELFEEFKEQEANKTMENLEEQKAKK